MKRIIVILIFVVIAKAHSFSQDSKYILRHVDGIQAIKIGEAFSFGNDKKTYTTILGYNYYITKKLFVDASINFETGTVENTKLTAFYLRVNGNYTLFQLGNTLFLNVAGGIFGGQERVKSEILQKDNKETTFIAGGDIGVTAEIFLNNTICLEPFVFQYYQFSSEVGNTFYNYGLNLKINF